VETIYNDAWQEISTEFSPVYECGARKTLASTSSTTAPESSVIVPNFNVYPLADEIVPLRHRITLSAISKACGPLTLITEIAPVPGTVAGAHIVSSFLMYIVWKYCIAKIEIYLLNNAENFLSSQRFPHPEWEANL
jgi:hypothetical protein